MSRDMSIVGLTVVCLLVGLCGQAGCGSVSETTGTPPPSNVAADNTVSCQITLTWEFTDTEVFAGQLSNETGFIIERRTGTTGEWAEVADITAENRSWTNAYATDDTMTLGTTYC